MTPEEKAAAEAKAAEEKKAKEKAAAEAKAAEEAELKALVESEKKKKLAQEVEDYHKFADLHMKMLDDNGKLDRKRIKESALKEYEKLEAKFKESKGKKPKKNANVFVGLGKGTCKIVEGYGVPKPIYDDFTDSKIAKHWFQ